MKNIQLLDILFILVSCVALILVEYSGYSEILSRFSYLVLIVGYSFGKLVSKYYEKKKINKSSNPHA